MNREEIIKIFEDNHIIVGRGVATVDATKLAKIWNKHEQDTLKEFVEWLKARFDKNAYNAHLRENSLLDINNTGNPASWYWDGYAKAIEKIDLDQDLENFIKEKSISCDNEEKQTP